MHIEAQKGRIFIGRFDCGGDLLSAIESFCSQNKINLGTFTIIGAVQNAKLGYYRQVEQKYIESASLDKRLEIVSCTGNISLREGAIAVHAHISLADHHGNAFGGHVLPGTTIFAAEFCIQELTGGELHRKNDSVTGLPLWG